MFPPTALRVHLHDHPHRFSGRPLGGEAEVRPGNRAVTHHVIAFLRAPGSKWFADRESGSAVRAKERRRRGRRSFGVAGRLCARSSPCDLGTRSGQTIPPVRTLFCSFTTLPTGSAERIVPRSAWFSLRSPEDASDDVGRDEHQVCDSTGRQQPQSRFAGYASRGYAAGFDDAAHAPSRQGFRVPRGVSDGRDGALLRVPKYDFNWQLYYYWPKPKRAAERHAHRLHGALRQFGEQSGQSGSQGRRFAGAIRPGKK